MLKRQYYVEGSPFFKVIIILTALAFGFTLLLQRKNPQLRSNSEADNDVMEWDWYVDFDPQNPDATEMPHNVCILPNGIYQQTCTWLTPLYLERREECLFAAICDSNDDKLLSSPNETCATRPLVVSSIIFPAAREYTVKTQKGLLSVDNLSVETSKTFSILDEDCAIRATFGRKNKELALTPSG